MEKELTAVAVDVDVNVNVDRIQTMNVYSIVNVETLNG